MTVEEEIYDFIVRGVDTYEKALKIAKRERDDAENFLKEKESKVTFYEQTLEEYKQYLKVNYS